MRRKHILWSGASHGGAEAAVELEHGELVEQLLGLLQVLRRRLQGVVRHHHLVRRRVDLCPFHMLLLATEVAGDEADEPGLLVVTARMQ